MAVPHFSVSIVARGSGRSAVLSAAYRHCAKMEYGREARTIDYTRKQDLLHEEFAIPADAPEWLREMIADHSVSTAAEVFWNRVEDFEKRSDAQLAKDITIALPIELSREQNIELTRDFVADHITARGMVADWVYHDAPDNPHIHLMTTLRPLTEDGFGPKKIAVTGPDGKPLRNDAGKIVYELWAGGIDDFNAFRDGWFACQNRHLARAGLDITVDGRSFEKQGIDLTPTIHLGVGARAIERKADIEGKAAELERLELQQERRAENARRIERHPDLVLDLISREKSVFDSHDIAKILHRYIDDAALFQSLMARILQSPQILRLDRERIDFESGARSLEKYTTQDLIRLEAGMAAQALWLSRRSSHGVRQSVLDTAFIQHTRLSEEQKTAIAHIAGRERIAAVVGRAGAGKTTMMKAARQAWQAAGYRVVGGALAGKAADGLEKEAGIVSRTLSSWELRWNEGRDQLDDKTIFVLDEAGMVSSRQMAMFVEAVTKAGAKLVLVGDPDQLQPIEAGAAFRAIADRIGYAELETIYRQQTQWMRNASLDLARGNVATGLEAYERAGLVRIASSRQDAIEALIETWNQEFQDQSSSLILAHRRRDVRELNELARAKLVDRGIVREGFAFRTEDGVRHFDVGDRIVFLKNEGSLGVKNGMLARVVDAGPGRVVAKIGDGTNRSQVTIEQRFYNNIDHGYATTIHKSQGATVDCVKVLASNTLDRHLTYVAMTRHRQTAEIYVGMDEFIGKRGGILIDHGAAPYEHQPDNRKSYFVTLAQRDGQQHTLWGVDLARAITDAKANIGDHIALEHKGSQPVTLPDGTTAERNSWHVVPLHEIAMERLKQRLSRDGSKETTLDYQQASSYRAALRFAQTRGLNLMNVARTIARDRRTWTVRQKQRLTDLGERLATIGARMWREIDLAMGLKGASNTTGPHTAINPKREVKPMVSGITLYPRTIEQVVDDRVAADTGLKTLWEEVSMRFHLVYAEPQAAFAAIDVNAMVRDQATATEKLAKILSRPETFGALKGKTGLFASRTDTTNRDRALNNVTALAASISDYLRQRSEVEQRHIANETARRDRVAIAIPALSENAKAVLKRVREAIDRNDLSAGLDYALADTMIKAELDGFAKAVSERFGERTFLPLAAKDSDGATYQRVTSGMNTAQKKEVAQSWKTMRTAQQLAAHERTASALKEAETLQQTKNQGMVLR